jgi:hypothetical protein
MLPDFRLKDRYMKRLAAQIHGCWFNKIIMYCNRIGLDLEEPIHFQKIYAKDRWHTKSFNIPNELARSDDGEGDVKIVEVKNLRSAMIIFKKICQGWMAHEVFQHPRRASTLRQW